MPTASITESSPRVTATPPLSAIPAEYVLSASAALLDVEPAARKCCPGASDVPASTVSMLINVAPQLLERRIFQPPMSTVALVGLKSSTNSSLAPSGPRERISLMTMCVGAIGVAVAVSVGVNVRVSIAVFVAVGVLQGLVVDDVLRGFGVPVEKSALLLSVSVQPFATRKSDVVLLGAGAFAPSLQFAVDPYPTKSTTLAEKGQPLPLNAVVEFTSATFPAVAAMPTLLDASGVGRFAPFAPSLLIFTK